MIDYWEAMGRMATNKDLNDQFQNRNVNQLAPEKVSVPQNKAATDIIGLAIQGPDYQKVQDLIGPNLTEQLLSLFSAGELIHTFISAESRQAMEKLIGLMSQSLPKLSSPSTSYFIALGLIIVDKDFRARMQEAGSDYASLLPRLSASEGQVVANLVNTQGLSKYSDQLGKIPWDLGCAVALQYWPGYLQPIAVNAPSKMPAQAVVGAYN